MKVGFTGTREGMTAGQVIQLRRFLDILLAGRSSSDVVLNHGGAGGADSMAALVATERNIRPMCFLPATRTPKAMLQRNHEIVDASELLIAAPLHDHEELRSGTWATVRYARQMKKTVVMLSRGEK